MKLNILSLLLSLFIQSNVYSKASNPNIANLTTEDGLSNNHVTAVLEDSKGFIWIATSDGLNKWNGYEFEIFKKENDNINSLPGNFILSLAEDQTDNIWIGTNNTGLVRYNISEERFYRYSAIAGDENSIPGNIIRCITVDDRDNVWIGTNAGLVRYDPVTDAFKQFQFPEGMTLRSSVDIRRIMPADEESLIIQNSLGLFILNMNNELIQKVGYEFPEYSEKLFTENEPICFDSHNNLWVGTTEALIKYNAKTGEVKKYYHDEKDHNSISSTTFSAIFEDNAQNIWIGTSNRGVNRYNPETDDFTVIKEDNYKDNSLTNNIITHIYQDSNSNIWFATQEGGVNYFNYKAEQFEYFVHSHLDPRSLTSNKIGSLYEDWDGNIWVGTKDGGINRFIEKEKAFEQFFINTAFVSPSILAIENQSENSLFVTGWEMGLYAFNTNTGESVNLMEGVEIDNRPLSINIKGMKVDSKGNVWLATHEKSGILVYDPYLKTFYNAASPGPYDKDLLSIEYAVSVVEDSKKRLWIVSYAGLYMYDSVLHTLNHVPNFSNTLSSDYNFDLFEDSEGGIWVGSANGLDKIIEKDGRLTVERFNDRYQLPVNIKGILEDNSGNLWLSSNREITKFNPKTGKVKQYTITNELPNQEFYERSRLKSSKGKMYFGGINGFLSFHPDSLQETETTPRVHIVDFQLFNKSQKVNAENSPLTKTISETQEIKLSHNQSVLTFEFVGLNFSPYRQLEYAYIMENFDEDWYFVGEKRFATYTNLPPGEYTFRVKLVENNILQDIGSAVTLKIAPPIWRTNWAYLVYVVLIALILYFFRKIVLYRAQLRNALKLEKLERQNIMETNLMKLRFFTNISHEFRTPLTLIKAPVEKLVKTIGHLDEKEQRYQLELIETNTHKLLHLINQLMDYRKLEAGSLVLEPSQGDIVEFCRKEWSVFCVLAEKANITYDFHTTIKAHIMTFDADKLDKIISNLLSNAFKNTHENGHISLNIERTFADLAETKGHIYIIVKDDGVGIPSGDLPRIFQRFYSVHRRGNNEVKDTGIGLALSKELAELHGGEILVESENGQGAIFKLMLPFEGYNGHLEEETNLALDEESKNEASDKKNEAEVFGQAKSNKHRILIVEDDDDLRLFLEKEFSTLFDVVMARDGIEGLSKAFAQIPDIIVSDITMPNMDGLEFCKNIRLDERTSHIPLILLTARYSQEKQLEGLDSGANDYITKPFNFELLSLKINNLLSSRQELINKFKKSTGLVFDVENVEGNDRSLIQSIINIVIENIEEEKINADFIAERINMSRSLVYLKVEALTGQSVNEFVRNIRLKKSIQLLRDNSLNVTEVAYAVGFSSQSYFTRSFVKQFGVSPTKFMKGEEIKL